ncbi:PepSY-associated TM helix domain-containing protein [Thalassotalea sediminis]|uniref:PepSY-associated TM helix domain-containing protein n=1 Tax=Thalassotalea sediminis TaxID=1759089 RepID=UPI00257256FF|nr:PepSY-associated TM helix domain-containing protein [Thalassotalea sediminis]
MKLILRRIHLLLALTSALFLLSLSISGALLLYAKDIQSSLFPQQWTIPESISAINVEQVIGSIEQQYNVKVAFITLPKETTAPWQVRLANGNYLNVDPEARSVIHQYDYYSTFYGFLMAFHRWLALDNTNKPLKVVMSIASLCLVLQLFLGGYLWLKPKKPLRRLKVRWKANNKIKYAQLHNLMGVILFVPLLLIAVSGMAFHWKDQIKFTLNLLFVDEIQSSIKPQVKTQKNTIVALNNALINGQKTFPQATLYRIYLPIKPNEPISLRYTQPEEAHGNSWVWLSPETGVPIKHFDASKTNVVTQVWNFRYPFHVGEFIGWPIKLLWLIISLTPVFFLVTGFYLYFARQPTKVVQSKINNEELA